MARTGLEEFREVIGDFKSLTSWTVKGAVVAPLADLVLHIGAPWPPGVPVITSVLELIALICVFHFWFGKSHKQLTKKMKVFLIVLCVSFFGYLYLFDTYTFVNPASSKRYAKGFNPLPNVEQLIPNGFKTADEVLENSEYKEEKVWTAGSITAVRLALLAVWLTMFASLSALIATFIMAQRRKTVKAPPRRRRSKKKEAVPVDPTPPENLPAAQPAQGGPDPVAQRSRLEYGASGVPGLVASQFHSLLPVLLILIQFIFQPVLFDTSVSAQRKAYRTSRASSSRARVVQDITCADTSISACIMSAAQRGKLTMFAKLAKASGIDVVLNGSGPYTIFIPTDEAFSALGPTKVQELLNPVNRDRLREIIYAHAVRGNMLMKEISQLKGSGTTAVSLQGLFWLDVAKEGTVNGARILKADVQASNGTIHIIDTVIVPDTNPPVAAPMPSEVVPAVPKTQRISARNVTVDSWPNEPVKIVAIKLRGGEQITPGARFQAVDDWVRGLTVTVTNVSKKPVCFIHIQLHLPRLDDEALPANDALMFACNPVNVSEPNPLLPGMSLDMVLTDSNYVAHEALLERNGYPPFVNNLELKVFEVQFFGDINTKWSKGQLMRQDPDRPGDWRPDRP